MSSSVKKGDAPAATEKSGGAVSKDEDVPSQKKAPSHRKDQSSQKEDTSSQKTDPSLQGKDAQSSREEDASSQKKPLVLFIDNRDSFVWNLVDAFSVAGADTVVKPNTVTLEEVRELDPDGVVISPGPGSPENPRDVGNCVEIVREVDVPVFGVCLGLQAIAVAFGGDVDRSPTGPVHGKPSDVKHDGTGLFDGFEGPVEGGRYHSLVVTDPGELEVTARNGDGKVMAAKHPSRPLYGVQFHPESVLTPDGERIVENFLGVVLKNRESTS